MVSFLCLFDTYNNVFTYLLYFVITGIQLSAFLLLLNFIVYNSLSFLKKIFLSFILLFTAVLGFLPFLISTDFIIRTEFIIFDFKVLSWTIYIINFYYVFFIIKNYKKTNGAEKRNILKTILILEIFFLPLWLLEYSWNFNFNNLIRPVTTANINYFIWNLISIIMFFKYIFILPKFSTDKSIPESFIRKYNITSRETEIINMINLGLANKQISNDLKITDDTVKNHIYNIYKKTGAQSRVDLVNLINEQMMIK